MHYQQADRWRISEFTYSVPSVSSGGGYENATEKSSTIVQTWKMQVRKMKCWRKHRQMAQPSMDRAAKQTL